MIWVLIVLAIVTAVVVVSLRAGAGRADYEESSVDDMVLHDMMNNEDEFDVGR